RAAHAHALSEEGTGARERRGEAAPRPRRDVDRVARRLAHALDELLGEDRLRRDVLRLWRIGHRLFGRRRALAAVKQAEQLDATLAVRERVVQLQEVAGPAVL